MAEWIKLLDHPDYRIAFALVISVFLAINHFAHFDLPTWSLPALVGACILCWVLAVFSVLNAWLRWRS